MQPVYTLRLVTSLALVWVCLLFSPFSLDAQTRIPHSQFVIERWSVNDGLPVNNVLKLHQSSDGYLWMATLDGLVRFDGIQFKVYQTINYKDLPTNRFVKLIEGPDGSLWIVSEQKFLIRFKNDEFTHIRNSDGLNGDYVHDIHLADSGQLWFGTDRGISVFDGEQIKPFQPDLIKGAIDRVFVDEGGAVWYRDFETLENFRFQDNRSDYIYTSPNGFHFNPVIENPDGEIWFSSLTHMYRFADDSLITCCTQDEFISNESFQPILQDASSASSRLINFSFVTGIGRYYTPEIGEIYSLLTPAFDVSQGDNIWTFSSDRLQHNGDLVLETKDNITSTLFDREGTLWVATSSDGLYQIKPNPFNSWSIAEGLPGINIYPVLEDSHGSIWAGTYGQGVGRIKDGVAEKVSRLNENVLSLHETFDGTLLMGVHRGGYYAFDNTTGQFIHQTEPEGILDATVSAIYENDNGDLWLGTSKGLFLKQDNKWSQFTGESGFTDDMVRFFLESPDGSLWMATNGSGVAQYHNESFQLFGSKQGLGSDHIRSLFIEPHADPENYTLWIGSEDQGLFRVDVQNGVPKPETTTQYSPADGMLDYVIHIILMDDNQNFWFNTNRGIFQVEKAELEAFHKDEISTITGIAYTEHDGLRNREGNGGMQPAGIRATDGTFWLPGQDGVTQVDPKNISANRVIPPVIIEEITTLEENLQLAGISQIELPAAERDFEFKFTSLSFIEPAKNQFRYRLKGYNDDWIDAGNRRTATYTNIPAGEYSFEVMGSNNTGVWSPETASIQLAVAPYFYETTWFTLLIVCLAGLLIFGGVSLRLRKLEKNELILRKLVDKKTEQLREEKEKTQQQADDLKELDRAKTRFFTNMSHEFRTPLTLIMGPLQQSLARPPEKFTAPTRDELQRMHRNSQRLLRLMDQTLELTKLEHGKLKLRVQKLDINRFLNDLTELFIPLCEENDLKLTFEENHAIGPIYADPNKLDKIVGNLLSNAIKFTPADGRITIKLQDEYDQLSLIVSDTGIGIAAEEKERVFDRFYQVDSSETRMHEGSGIGLSLAREFATLHRGALRVESEQGSGTTFTLTLKKGSSHFTEEELHKQDNPQPFVQLNGSAPHRDNKQRTTDETAKPDTRVLIVEDNPDVRSFIREVLEHQYHVIEATDGKEGLIQVGNYLPDLIIADIMMPEMDGITFNQELKKEASTASIPLIFLTAKSTVNNQLEGLMEGADDYITKPFDPALLKARVENLIESRLRLRHLLQSDRQSLDEKEGSFLSKMDPDPFVMEIADVLDHHFSDPDFQVSTLAEELHLDRSYMARKIKKATGMTPGDLIKTYRMEKASALLKENNGNISEVAYAVGFNSLSYFSQTFKEHFDKTPSEFLGVVSLEK